MPSVIFSEAYVFPVLAAILLFPVVGRCLNCQYPEDSHFDLVVVKIPRFAVEIWTLSDSVTVPKMRQIYSATSKFKHTALLAFAYRVSCVPGNENIIEHQSVSKCKMARQNFTICFFYEQV